MRTLPGKMLGNARTQNVLSIQNEKPGAKILNADGLAIPKTSID